LLDIEPEGHRTAGQCASNTEIFRWLAKTFGFDDPQFTRTGREMIEYYIDRSAP
jgi:hypothetical protein